MRSGRRAPASDAPARRATPERYRAFEDWYKNTLALPGATFLWVVEHLFLCNRLIRCDLEGARASCHPARATIGGRPRTGRAAGGGSRWRGRRGPRGSAARLRTRLEWHCSRHPLAPTAKARRRIRQWAKETRENSPGNWCSTSARQAAPRARTRADTSGCSRSRCFDINGAVTCLAVSGTRAVIGFHDEGSFSMGQVVVQVEDNGGPDSGLDTITFGTFGDPRAPTDCSPIPGAIRVVTGDIAVPRRTAPPYLEGAMQERRLAQLHRLQERGPVRRVRRTRAEALDHSQANSRKAPGLVS